MDSPQGVYIILWIWTLLYTIPSVIGLHRTRRLNPVRYRRPDVLMIFAVAMILTMTCECISHIIPQHYRWIGVTNIVLRLILDDVLQSCFMIIIFSLFSIFSISKRRIGIGEIGDAAQLTDHEKEQAVARLVKWINWCKFLLTIRFAIMVIAVNLLIVTILAAAVALAADGTFLVETLPCRFMEVPICFNLGIVHLSKTTLCLIACLIMSYQMRVVVDELGLKRNVRLVLISATITFVTLNAIQYLALHSTLREWDPKSMFLVGIFGPINFGLFVMKPIVEALHKKSEPARLRVHYDNDYLEFEGFLMTQAGFTSFRAQLEKEFCVENLLFWKAAIEFRQLKDKKKIADKEIEIFKMFLAKDAPMEIQLSDDLKQRYREMTYGHDGSIRHMKIEVVNEQMQTTIQLKSLKTEVFLAAMKEVIVNLRHGSFPRYLASAANSALWTEYLHSRQMHGMYANMIGGQVIPAALPTTRATSFDADTASHI